jgi:hypothetical protein
MPTRLSTCHSQRATRRRGCSPPLDAWRATAASVQAYHLGGPPRFSRVDRGREAQSTAETRNAGLPDRLVDPQSTPNVHIAVMGMVEE